MSGWRFSNLVQIPSPLPLPSCNRARDILIKYCRFQSSINILIRCFDVKSQPVVLLTKPTFLDKEVTNNDYLKKVKTAVRSLLWRAL